MEAAITANNNTGISIALKMLFFLFANEGFLQSKFAEKSFYTTAKVLIKEDFLNRIFCFQKIKFPDNNKYPQQNNNKSDLLDYRQIKNKATPKH